MSGPLAGIKVIEIGQALFAPCRSCEAARQLKAPPSGQRHRM
jgi:hypothetical protein